MFIVYFDGKSIVIMCWKEIKTRSSNVEGSFPFSQSPIDPTTTTTRLHTLELPRYQSPIDPFHDLCWLLTRPSKVRVDATIDDQHHGSCIATFPARRFFLDGEPSPFL